MAQTVIGFFDNVEEGTRAVNQLQQIGLSRDSIDMTENSGTAGVSGSGESTNERENGITRFFKNLFGDDSQEADRYSRVGNSSRCIVTVHAQSTDQAQAAADILDACGAIDVDERASHYQGNLVSDNRHSTATEERGATIPRIREELEVGKRTVESGGVRLRSRIVERPVEESIRLREEHVSIQREPVNRPLSEADRDAFQERDIELTERAEVPVVNKEARVVEEISLNKEVTERDETIHDTVRNTEIDIDRIDEKTGRTRSEDRGSI
jgi:stress response protein YsnF